MDRETRRCERAGGEPRRVAAGRVQPLFWGSGRASRGTGQPGMLGDLLMCSSVTPNAAAAICAISMSFGGVLDKPANASRNIVLQNGHAAPTTAAPVAASSSARVTLTRL